MSKQINLNLHLKGQIKIEGLSKEAIQKDPQID
jgi:hypothetical protein